MTEAGGGDGRAADPAEAPGRPDAPDRRVGATETAGPASLVRLAALREEPVAIGELHEAVRDPRCGAIVTYEGTPRDVAALDYEAYAPMVERVLAELAAEVGARHGCHGVAVVHRVGLVPAGQPSIVVSASSPHRAAAFAACRELLDAVKANAPIWKTEVGADGERRVVEGELPPG